MKKLQFLSLFAAILFYKTCYCSEPPGGPSCSPFIFINNKCDEYNQCFFEKTNAELISDSELTYFLLEYMKIKEKMTELSNLIDKKKIEQAKRKTKKYFSEAKKFDEELTKALLNKPKILFPIHLSHLKTLQKKRENKREALSYLLSLKYAAKDILNNN